MSKKSRRKVFKKSKRELLNERRKLVALSFTAFAFIIFGVYLAIARLPGPSVFSPTDERLIRLGSQTVGRLDAKVTVVEFVDLACDACAQYNPLLKNILETYDGKVNIIVRHLPTQKNSFLAAKAAESAALQGKFWEMENILLMRQDEWMDKGDDFRIYLSERAKELGLGIDKFNNELDSVIIDRKIHIDIVDAENIGVRSTPTFFVNGRRLAHATGKNFAELIDQFLKNEEKLNLK